MDWYLLFKTLHILGAVLFVGNAVVTGMWKAMADRTREPKIIAYAQRLVTQTDWVFTAGGVMLVLIGGFGAAAVNGTSLLSPWVVAGLALLIASGAIWHFVLIPIQRKLGRMAREFAGGGPIPEEFWRLERRWAVYGSAASILPLAAIVDMVFKFGG